MLPTLDEIPKKRKALGLTQTKLAQLAGVSQSIIAKIESGTVDPSYSIAKRLVEALEKESIQTSRPRVSEIMSRPVISVSKTQLVREAVDLMRKRGYSPLPMVNDDTPLEMVLGLLQGNYGVLVTKGESTIGILTKSDILKVKQ